MNKKITLFFMTLLLTQATLVQANYPYHRFKELNLKLGLPRYNRYIRPQLKNIIADFFHIMKKIEPAEQDLISIRSHTQNMNDIWDEWTSQCGENQVTNCHKILNSLYKKSRDLDTIILSFQNQRLRIKNFGDSQILDTVLHLTSALDKISSINYMILHFAEESLMTDTTTYQANSLVKGKFTVHLQEMLVSSELILSALITPEFRVVFNQVWYGFIKPVERQIVHQEDPDYLLKHLGDLNLAWNAFHMRVAKSELRMNKSELQTVLIMHNRWNSILKVLLRH
jgi:hypothetical protein